MTLPFSTVINGQPNYFIEKIWSGLTQSQLCSTNEQLVYSTQYSEKFCQQWDVPEFTPFGKYHTIRLDVLDRWNPGCKIHFVTGNRTKDRFQFAPVLEVLSVQKLLIYQDKFDTIVAIDGFEIGRLHQNQSRLHQLAINDGFNNTKEFLDYFNHDFSGKIIHWTPLKY